MFVYNVATVDDLMRAAVQLVKNHGQRIVTHKGPCREVVAAAFELTQPRARLSRTWSRGRLFSSLGELCWYLAGSNETEFIARYIAKYRELDEDGRIYGGYGPRLFDFDGRNQIQYVIDQLRSSPTSRQAVIQLFDHDDVRVRHKDIPCTCTLQYFVRNERLEAITYMRSNDVHIGLPHDIFCFTMLQELIATALGVGLGSYHHFVGGLHVYEQDEAAVEEFLHEGLQATNLSMPPMPPGDPRPHVEHLLAVEQRLRAGTSSTEVEFDDTPYWADLERLLKVFFAPKDDRDQIVALKDQLTDDYYENFVWDRLDRAQQPEEK